MIRALLPPARPRAARGSAGRVYGEQSQQEVQHEFSTEPLLPRLWRATVKTRHGTFRAVGASERGAYVVALRMATQERTKR